MSTNKVKVIKGASMVRKGGPGKSFVLIMVILKELMRLYKKQGLAIDFDAQANVTDFLRVGNENIKIGEGSAPLLTKSLEGKEGDYVIKCKKDTLKGPKDFFLIPGIKDDLLDMEDWDEKTLNFMEEVIDMSPEEGMKLVREFVEYERQVPEMFSKNLKLIEQEWEKKFPRKKLDYMICDLPWIGSRLGKTIGKNMDFIVMPAEDFSSLQGMQIVVDKIRKYSEDIKIIILINKAREKKNYNELLGTDQVFFDEVKDSFGGKKNIFIVERTIRYAPIAKDAMNVGQFIEIGDKKHPINKDIRDAAKIIGKIIWPNL